MSRRQLTILAATPLIAASMVCKPAASSAWACADDTNVSPLMSRPEASEMAERGLCMLEQIRTMKEPEEERGEEPHRAFMLRATPALQTSENGHP
ncbi:hypothetical protein D3C71_1406270 [compost metagenome]